MASCLDADHAEVSLEAGFHFVDVATTLLVAVTQSWAAIFKEKAKHRIFLVGQKPDWLPFPCLGSK